MRQYHPLRLKDSNVWFTSDYHLFHKNIIRLSSRPFDSVMEMNEEIRDRHNALVSKDDTVFNLGDLMLLPRQVTKEEIEAAVDFLKSFNGNINYVVGNHEQHIQYVNHPNWVARDPLVEIIVPNGTERGQGVILCHYALRTWDAAHYGTWHLFGHSHGGLKDDNGERFSENEKSLSMDVGVDTNDYKPYSYEDIKQIMATKKFSPTDHHVARPSSIPVARH